MPSSRPPLAIIFLTIFIDLLGVGILIPVIPQLLANPLSPQFLLPAGWSLSQGYILLGALTASYPIAQFFAAPILGQLSDRFGRRPILLLSLLGTAIGYALFAIAILLGNIPLLFLSRILDGITGGNISVAQAAIADVTTPENRSKNFGLIGAAFGLGFIIGPYIGGQLANDHLVSWFNASTPFWFAAILSVINVILLFNFLPETNAHLTRQPLDWGKSFHDIVKAVSLKDLRWMFIVIFLYTTGFSFFVSFFGVYLIERFGFDQGSIGNLFAYIGIWIAVTQGAITPMVSKKWKERAVLNVTVLGTGIVLLLFLLPGPWPILLFVVPFFSLMNGLSQANLIGFLSRRASQKMQGEVLGINASVSALAQALPPILSGVIAAESSAASTVIVASIVIIIGGLVFLFTIRDIPMDAHEGAPSVAS